MLESFLAALITGFGMSIPPGPINFSIFERSIRGHRHSALLLTAGGITGDGLYCFLAIIYQLSTEMLFLVKVIFSAFGGIFLLGLGSYYTFIKQPVSHNPGSGEVDRAHHGDYITGLFIALSNPFFIVAMIALTELYYSLGILEPSLGPNILFVIGFQLGAFLWLASMGHLAARHRHHFTGVTHRIQRLSGWAYILFGLYMIGKFVKLMWIH